MPGQVRTAVIAFGVSGVAMVLIALVAVLGDGQSGVTDLAGLLGIVELTVVGRLFEHKQWARLTAMGLALLQTGLGVAALVEAAPVGLLMIALAGLVVIPLSGSEADRFFGVTT